MEYLTSEDILNIHSVVVDETGGSHGVRDVHALASVEGQPQQEVFGQVLYPDLFSKAAVYVRGILMGHPFIDGNKRTAVTTADVFLQLNGYRINAKQGDVEIFALTAIEKKWDIPEMAVWLRDHTEKLQK